MIVGIGTDIVAVQRIAKSIEQYGDRFLKRIFTPLEVEYCSQFKIDQVVHYAARFAYKEAFSKAIGTGISRGFQFKDCGVRNLPSGKPIADLSGELDSRWGSHKIHVSLSHTQEFAVAMVVIESEATE